LVTRVKICGITRLRDAEEALELGAHALGFVLEPSSSRYVGHNRELLRGLARLRPFATLVAVFGPYRPEEDLAPFDAVQALDLPVQTGFRKTIRAVRLQGEEEIEAATAGRGADALLLDAFHPEAYGGTGTVLDWDRARRIVELAEVNVILAGGLVAENVGQAIERVRPYGVDVSSGVEASPGIKDPEKIRRFIEAASF
jgi:phosphoribosylanthranilate isomerase